MFDNVLLSPEEFETEKITLRVFDRFVDLFLNVVPDDH